MDTQEKTMSEQESFALINRMIASAQNKISDDGLQYLFWGVLVIVASLGQYILASLEVENNYLPWMIFPIVGIPVSIWLGWKSGRKQQVRTYVDRFYPMIWLGFGITVFFLVYFAVKNNLSPVPFILAAVGFATFISGTVLRFRALIVGSFVFWASSFLCAFLNPSDQLLVNAGATLFGYIIPGYMLWKKSKSESNVQTA